MDKTFFDDLAKKVSDILPDGIKAAGQDCEQNIKQVLQTGLAKLDMVPREEFDTQVQVLKRTREKLTVLEQQVAVLEAQLKNQASSK